MVLNKLKQIRNELKNSADTYDTAFKNTALMAADELVKEEKHLKEQLKSNQYLFNLNPSLNLNKQHFIDKYGSLKNAKAAYQKIHGEQKYGRSWSDFLTVVKKLSSPEQPALTLEEKVTKIENFLSSLGY